MRRSKSPLTAAEKSLRDDRSLTWKYAGQDPDEPWVVDLMEGQGRVFDMAMVSDSL
jgi:hypothetical protein